NSCLSLEGHTIECGVYKGGSSAIIAQFIAGTGKKHYLCDSFTGLPEHTGKDNRHRRGCFGDTALERVQAGLRVLGLEDCTVVKPGWFRDTLPTLSGQTFCFAHIDADMYQSTLECLDFLYPRMTVGGWIVIDDYNCPDCLGAKEAVDVFL